MLWQGGRPARPLAVPPLLAATCRGAHCLLHLGGGTRPGPASLRCFIQPAPPAQIASCGASCPSLSGLLPPACVSQISTTTFFFYLCRPPDPSQLWNAH